MTKGMTTWLRFRSAAFDCPQRDSLRSSSPYSSNRLQPGDTRPGPRGMELDGALTGGAMEGELEVGSAMKPKIERTAFGSVTIDGEVYEHDVLIRLDGQVKKRKKKLSKAVYGTSHTISLAEARHVHQKGADRVIIGAGQDGRVTLSDEAAAYFEQNGCKVDLRPTPEAIPAWNDAQGHVIGLLHVTC
jgi:hypothetical protein